MLRSPCFGLLSFGRLAARPRLEFLPGVDSGGAGAPGALESGCRPGWTAGGAGLSWPRQASSSKLGIDLIADRPPAALVWVPKGASDGGCTGSRRCCSPPYLWGVIAIPMSAPGSNTVSIRDQ